MDHWKKYSELASFLESLQISLCLTSYSLDPTSYPIIPLPKSFHWRFSLKDKAQGFQFDPKDLPHQSLSPGVWGFLLPRENYIPVVKVGRATSSVSWGSSPCALETFWNEDYFQWPRSGNKNHIPPHVRIHSRSWLSCVRSLGLFLVVTSLQSPCDQ